MLVGFKSGSPFVQQHGPQQNAAGDNNDPESPRRAGDIFVYFLYSPGKKKKVKTMPKTR
jgi:hypothetical protein